MSGDPQREERILRKKLRTGKIEPTPPNTIVTGRLPGVRITPRLERCDGHVWRTKRAKRNEHWQSGWVQAATCVNCGDTIPAIDASWWCEVATPDRIKLAISLMEEEIEGLQKRKRYLERKLEK